MQVNAQKRNIKGKKVKQLRRKGFVPGVISLANNRPSILLSISEIDANKLAKLKQIEKIEVIVEDQKFEALMSEIVVDPVSNKILHVNFVEVTPNSHVTIFVPIRLKGVSPAVKNNIGVLLRNLSYVRLVFNSENIIPYLEVDISGLDSVGDRILFTQDLLPEGVKPANFKEFGQTIVTIRPPQKVRVEATSAEGEAESETEGEGSSAEAGQQETASQQE